MTASQPEEKTSGAHEMAGSSAKKWPIPGWRTGEATTGKARTYKYYLTRDLRARYDELEGDYRTALIPTKPGDAIYGPTRERIVSFLDSAREALEGQDPDLINVSKALYLAEQHMITLYRGWMLTAKTATVIHRLRNLRPEGWESFVNYLKPLSDPEPNSEEKKGDRNVLLGRLDEAVGMLGRHEAQSQIRNGLQIMRLKTQRKWGLILFAVFLVASPLAINPDTLKELPTISLLPQWVTVLWPNALAIAVLSWSNALASEVSLWLSACAIAVMGAVGGFLSGLLHARSSHVTLADYEEHVLKLQLKLLIGAIVALVLFILLSWGIIAGVETANPGIYFLVAFLSGFSERYFLRLLNVDGDAETEKQTEASKPATVGKG